MRVLLLKFVAVVVVIERFVCHPHNLEGPIVYACMYSMKMSEYIECRFWHQALSKARKELLV